MSLEISKLEAFYEAFLIPDVDMVERLFQEYLRKTISIRDIRVRKGKKKNFDHGILFGLINYREDRDVYSCTESREGYSDILINLKKRE